jgi:hypothetical protein
MILVFELLPGYPVFLEKNPDAIQPVKGLSNFVFHPLFLKH